MKYETSEERYGQKDSAMLTGNDNKDSVALYMTDWKK